MAEEFETLLVITQRDATTVLEPLPTGGTMTLTVLGGLPGPVGPMPDSLNDFDPGDFTVDFRNGLV